VRRREFITLLGGAAVAWPLSARAQQSAKVPRVGFMGNSTEALEANLVGPFREGLRELGYEEGRNIIIEYRWAEGKYERFPALIAELLAGNLDVIVTAGTPASLAVKKATSSVPLVMIAVGEPVATGLVASLARPGGNVTGFATLYDELPGKWVELLKETLPTVSRVAVLWDRAGGEPRQVKTSEIAARSLGVRLQVLEVARPDDFGTAFTEAQKNHAEALVVLSSAFFFAHRTRLVELAAKHRLPAMYHQKEFVVSSGGLMSYGPDFHDLFRRAAIYVDRILRGAKPADLPVERPTKFELIINLKTAKALGLTIPQSVLLRADEIIQ
jgi:ABC-type uncharacterized transport system substrate-binding protein